MPSERFTVDPVSWLDAYQDRDVYAVTMGANANQLSVRLNWSSTTADLDFYVFAAPENLAALSGEMKAAPGMIRLNGRGAVEAFRTLPETLEEGDTVRLRIRREGGGEREVVVIAERRPEMRFGFVRPGRGERPMVFFDRDSVEFPLEALTMRIDSLHTHLLHLDSGMVRIQLDSLVHLFYDSARVFIQRMPNVEFRLEGPELEALRLEGRLEGLDEELEAQLFRLDELEGLRERPFFMELGRRAAAGAPGPDDVISQLVEQGWTNPKRAIDTTCPAVRHLEQGAERRPVPRSGAVCYTAGTIRLPPRLMLAVRGPLSLPFGVAPTSALPTAIFLLVAIREAVTT